MRCFEERDRLKRKGVSDLTEAYKLLTEPKAALPPSDTLPLSDSDSTRFAQLEAILKEHRDEFMRVCSALLEMRGLDPDAFSSWCEENGINTEMVALVEELFVQG